MFTTDFNSVPNDPGADSGSSSSVFTDIFSSATGAVNALVTSTNAAQQQQAQLAAQTKTTTLLIGVVGLALIAWIIFK